MLFSHFNIHKFIAIFSACILKGDSEFIFHAGDTRVYRLHDNTLELLTRYYGKFGPSADQFSLAVLLYEMLTSKQPYGSGSSKATDLKTSSG